MYYYIFITLQFQDNYDIIIFVYLNRLFLLQFKRKKTNGGTFYVIRYRDRSGCKNEKDY